MKLYEIEAKYRDLVEMLESDTVDPNHFKAFDEIQEERGHKIAAICTLIKEARYEAEALKAEAKAMAHRADIAESVAERLCSYLEYVLTPGEKWKDTHHAISWRTSEGVLVTDMSRVPDQFWVTPEPTISKIKIKEALKAGEAVPGAKLEKRNNIQVR